MSLERLIAFERKTPEWRSWIAMLRLLAQAVDDPVWLNPVAEPTDAGQDRPQLDAQYIQIPEAATVELIQHLLEIAIEERSPPLTERVCLQGLLPLLHASIAGTSDEIEKTALRIGIDPSRLGTVINAAAIPLLGACAVQLARQVPHHWPHGYCPVCGAWPVLAELIGLDRSRHLRCGRCGTGWDTRWLVCPFCQETDHAQLGALVSGTAVDGPRVETCRTCRGFLKTIAVLTRGSHLEILLADLESVALDLAARGEGFVRPNVPSHALTVTLFPSGSAG